jgi:hypothetical protein
LAKSRKESGEETGESYSRAERSGGEEGTTATDESSFDSDTEAAEQSTETGEFVEGIILASGDEVVVHSFVEFSVDGGESGLG